jgi:hypothetical protein
MVSSFIKKLLNLVSSETVESERWQILDEAKYLKNKSNL